MKPLAKAQTSDVNYVLLRSHDATVLQHMSAV